MAKYGWPLWIVFALLLAASLWWLTQPLAADATNMQPVPEFGSSNGPIPTRAEFTDLQRKTDAACLCGRARGGPWDEQCWADYQRSVARFEPASMASACAEQSTSVDCFGPAGENQLCVSTGRMYGACSDAEQQTRMAAARRRNQSGCGG